MASDPFREPTAVLPALEEDHILGGAAGNHTVTGISTQDTLLKVIHHPVLTEAAPNTYQAPVDITSEFTISAAGVINNTGGTNTTGGWLAIRWYDHDLGFRTSAPWI